MSATLAIDGGKPVRSRFLPFALPCIGDEEIAEVVDTLRSGWLTTGPRVKAFEAAFCDYTGAPHAVAVSSCTAALHLALLANRIGAGDEVITTPLTFASTANTILMVGARPLFVDIDRSTYNIDPDAVEQAISRRTRAIVPVHYAGLPAEMEPIMRLAEEHGLHVIEDAAHATGARYGSARVGNVSDMTCFSFYATKTMTTGEGGMVTTRSRELADRVRMLSLHGLSRDAWDRYSEKGSWYYEIVELGYKYNMGDIQAALGLRQLEKVDHFTRRRREIAALYSEAFAGLEEIILPSGDNERSEHIYHLYPIRLRLDRLETTRSRFFEALRAENIGASVHFIPLHLHPFYRRKLGFREGDFPVAEAVYGSMVSLPIYPDLTDSDVADVVAAVSKIVGHCRG